MFNLATTNSQKENTYYNSDQQIYRLFSIIIFLFYLFWQRAQKFNSYKQFWGGFTCMLNWYIVFQTHLRYFFCYEGKRWIDFLDYYAFFIFMREIAVCVIIFIYDNKIKWRCERRRFYELLVPAIEFFYELSKKFENCRAN